MDTLKNIRITNSLIDIKYKSEDYKDVINIHLGTLVGTAENTTVYNCQNDASVMINCEGEAEQDGNTMGGLVGSLTIDWEKPTIITNCHNSENIQTNFDNMTAQPLPIGAFGMGIDVAKITLLH